jgi:cytochrome c-type biogenesis protein CcmH/NrfG
VVPPYAIEYRKRADFRGGLPGIRLAPLRTMAIAHATKSILLIAFLAAFSALSVAMGLTRVSQHEMVAPEAWSALERHDAERAASLFGQELKQRPRDPVLHFGAGSAAYALGRTGPALSSLRRAVELDPQFAEALMMLGQVAYERGDSDLAIRSMQKASALRPRNSDLTELLDRWRRESSVHNSYVERPEEHFRILYRASAIKWRVSSRESIGASERP